MADCFVEPLCGVEQSSARAVNLREVSQNNSNENKSFVDPNTVGLPATRENFNQPILEVSISNGDFQKCKPLSPGSSSNEGAVLHASTLEFNPSRGNEGRLVFVSEESSKCKSICMSPGDDFVVFE